LVHTVTVKPYAGRTSVGETYGTSFPLACFAEGKRRWVAGNDGTKAMATLTLYAAPGQAAEIPAGSQVVWGSTTTTVIGSTDHDSGGMGAPDHTEVVCQ
jgi:hypothetical protein